jgi:hypothetical protein
MDGYKQNLRLQHDWDCSQWHNFFPLSLQVTVDYLHKNLRDKRWIRQILCINKLSDTQDLSNSCCEWISLINTQYFSQLSAERIYSKFPTRSKKQICNFGNLQPKTKVHIGVQNHLMPVLNDMLRGYKHQLNLLVSRNSNLQYIYHFTASGK